MKHDFINDQIWHAAKQAALATDYYRIVPTNYLQAFINALPDPSYPEIALDDVRKGDIESMHELRKVLAAHAPDWGNND